ncbi:MAG: dihydrofolate reductase [Nitrosospira sp.]|nr:dihydrofolate reductase [Nitrosospira sp.]MDN5881432.1 dihydrofolate reductase [Nitrosospira sp.]
MTSHLSALVAMAQNRVIGKDNALPWRLPPDLKRFKALTMGHSIIMGRKTYESIGKPLPGRTCIIVTRQPGYEVEGAIVAGSVAEALTACRRNKAHQRGEGQDHKDADTDMAVENFVIGGAEIFRQTLPLCDRLYITEIQQDFDGDVLFPELDRDEWREISREKHRLDDNGLEYDFVVLDRESRNP